ncbi:MAG: YhjD/YihY/BrkB family envelope integrity protein [Desulfohalobiaceae bacterium]
MQKAKVYLNRLWDWLLQLWEDFRDDQCLLRASALTYATALSIVPLLAVAFAISKGFGFQNTHYIREFLLRVSADRPEVVDQIITYINQTNVSTLGAVGVAFLLLTVFTLLSGIEQSLNSIWGVSQERTLARKFSDYLSVILVCPLLIISAFSFSASLQSTTLVQMILSFSVFSYIYLIFLKYLPIIMVMLAFFFIYKLVPNARVSNKGCLLGAAVAGILWHLAQKAFISYQIGVSKYNAIYGSFAQLPLFLIWLYISWVIVLFGAELGAVLEKRRKGQLAGNRLEEFGLEFKERLVLGIMLYLVQAFQAGKGPMSVEDLAEGLGLPLPLIQRPLQVLVQLGYVLQVEGKRASAYSPAKGPAHSTCLDLLQEFRAYTEKVRLASSLQELEPVQKYLQDIYALARKQGLNRSLAQMAQEL